MTQLTPRYRRASLPLKFTAHLVPFDIVGATLTSVSRPSVNHDRMNRAQIQGQKTTRAILHSHHRTLSDGTLDHESTATKKRALAYGAVRGSKTLTELFCSRRQLAKKLHNRNFLRGRHAKPLTVHRGGSTFLESVTFPATTVSHCPHSMIILCFT